MEHISKNGKTYDICSLVEYKGGAFYDIVVILEWGEPPEIVSFYFGDYDYEVTEEYIEEYETKNNVT